MPGCWPASDDAATLVRTHGAVSSVRTVGLASHEACSRAWRLRRLSSSWSQLHRQQQHEWAAVDILTAAAARRVLPPACAGTDPTRLVGDNGTLTTRAVKRRKLSRGGPGCVALVLESDVLLAADALRDACLYYGAESFDAVLHAALPAALPRASRHPSHAFPVAAKSLRLPDQCMGAGSRHMSFLSMRALDALAALSLVHAPRFRQKSQAGQPCRIDRLAVSLLPALGISSLWLGGSAQLARCGFFVAGPACKPTLLAGSSLAVPSAAGVPPTRRLSEPSSIRGRSLLIAAAKSHPGGQASKGGSHRRLRLAPQYGCAAVRHTARGLCVPPPWSAAHEGGAEGSGASEPRPARVFDSALWEVSNASHVHLGGMCGRGSLQCVSLRAPSSDATHTRAAQLTPRLVVRPDARNPAAAAIIASWAVPPEAMDTAPVSSEPSPLAADQPTTTSDGSVASGSPPLPLPPPPPAPQPVHLLSVHLAGRSFQLAALPLLDALARVRSSSATEFDYPADSLAQVMHSRTPVARRGKGGGGKPGQQAVAAGVLTPRDVPPARRIRRSNAPSADTPPRPVATGAGGEGDAAGDGGDGTPELAAWHRMRALGAVVLMVSGWLLLAGAARCVLLRWSEDDDADLASRSQTEGLLSAGSVGRDGNYVLPKNLRRQLAGGRSRLGDARSTPGSLPLIAEGAHESQSEGSVTGSEGSPTSPRSQTPVVDFAARLQLASPGSDSGRRKS